jgi:DNA polymerase-3 subunit delta
MDANGTSADETVRTDKPPIFFRRVDAYARALRLWQANDLSNFLDAFSTAERDCKRTGWPDETLARHAVLMLATGAIEKQQERNQR